jgi:hypothetical protein
MNSHSGERSALLKIIEKDKQKLYDGKLRNAGQILQNTSRGMAHGHIFFTFAARDAQ